MKLKYTMQREHTNTQHATITNTGKHTMERLGESISNTDNSPEHNGNKQQNRVKTAVK